MSTLTEEVSPGVHRLETPFGDRMNCLYLLTGESRCLLVDTGMSETVDRYVVPALRELGREPAGLDYVVVTHSDIDHLGGAGRLRQLAPRAVFIGHELDRACIEDLDRLIEDKYGEFRPDGIEDTEEARASMRATASTAPLDLAVTGGERVRLGAGWEVEILHTPGHSPGHLSLYDARSNTLLISDAALSTTLRRRDGSPAFPPTYRFVDSYVATLQRLHGIGANTLLTGHFPVFRGPEVSDFLLESRAYVDRVDSALRRRLRESPDPSTLQALITDLAPVLGEWTEGLDFLAHPLTGHLERLEHYGLVRRATKDGTRAWEWAG